MRTGSHARPAGRRLATVLLAAAVTMASAAAAFAADTVVLRVGDQKGGNRSLLEMAGIAPSEATFAPLNPVDAKVALMAGSVDAWAVWDPYVSFATLKDKARPVADGAGLTPTITFIVASDDAIATKRAALQDFL